MKNTSHIWALLSGITIYLCVFIFSPATVYATDVSVGAPTTVVATNQIVPVVSPFSGQPTPSIDAPLTTFMSGGIRYWLNSVGAYQTMYQGTLDKPFQNPIWTKDTKTLFSDPYHLGIGGPWKEIDAENFTFGGSAIWVVNNYQVSDKEILAFLHVEVPTVVNGVYSTGKSKIGLAWSSDGGASFTYLGDILEYPGTTGEYNMQGAPYVIKDGYFYLYYHDLCSYPATTVAREDVATVVNAARSGKVTAWNKYYNGGWNESGLGGQCSPVNIMPGVDTTDATYSTYTGKYYLLLSQYSNSGSNTWIKLFESTDGINWTFIKDIVNEPPSTDTAGYQYVSIVNSDGNDNGVVGQSFYVYSAKNLYNNPTISRWLITLNTPASLPTPSLKPGDLNSDSKVDINDYNILMGNFGKTGIGIVGDIDGNGNVDIFDYNILVGSFGK